MATISTEAGRDTQEFTFTSATTPPTVASSQEVILIKSGDSVNGDSALGHQFIKVSATMTNASATATLVFQWVDLDSDTATSAPRGAGRFDYDTAAIAAHASFRQDHDSAGGDYLTTVAFAISGKNTLDLHKVGRNVKLYVGCSVISAGSIVVRVTPGRAV